MHDDSGGRDNRGGPRDGRGGDRPRDEGGERGPGPDTRFLQLELSQVLYSEAEAVVRPAFRDLLMEAAKDRLRERFGDEITALARLAVDDLLKGMKASFEIESRVQQHGEEQRQPSELQEMFAAWRTRSESRVAPAGPSPRRTAARAKKRR